MGLAMCAVHDSRFAEADHQLVDVARADVLTPDMAGSVLLLARIALFRGDARAAREQCDRLVLTFPSSDEANDCLTLTGVLSDARGDSVAWRTYGRASFLLAVGDDAGAAATAESLATSSLAGHGALLAAAAWSDAGEHVRAAAALRSAVAGQEGNPIGEEALWRLAELLRTDVGDNAGALQAYEELLRRYPQSVFVGRARRRIRELREGAGAT